MSRNLAASIRACLKQRADTKKQDFNLILTHYGLERLLYRLSISPLAGNYLLRGALLFSLWYDRPHRPTSILPLPPSVRSVRWRWKTASRLTSLRSRAR
jgi:hypothetical protein